MCCWYFIPKCYFLFFFSFLVELLKQNVDVAAENLRAEGIEVLVGGGFSSILWFAKRWRQSGKVGFTDGEKEEGWWKKAAAVGGRWVCACLYGVVILSRSVYRHFGTKAKMLKRFFFFYQNFKRLNILYKISIFILIF